MRALCSLFLVLFLTLVSVQQSAAQTEYKTAVGLRLGYPWSLSLKKFISDKGAVEVFGGFRGWTYYRWFNVGATYQHHTPIEGVEGLKWFAGGGASAYFWSFDDGFINDGAGDVSFAALGVVGLDYKVKDHPLNISVDWMPAIFFNGYYTNRFGYGYGAVALRYTLN